MPRTTAELALTINGSIVGTLATTLATTFPTLQYVCRLFDGQVCFEALK